MQQNARFIRKLPIPMDIKKEFPITEQITEAREKRKRSPRCVRRAWKRCARSSTGVTAA